MPGHSRMSRQRRYARYQTPVWLRLSTMLSGASRRTTTHIRSSRQFHAAPDLRIKRNEYTPPPSSQTQNEGSYRDGASSQKSYPLEGFAQKHRGKYNRKNMDVSLRAASKATGAFVIAQRATPYANKELPPPSMPLNQCFLTCCMT